MGQTGGETDPQRAKLAIIRALGFHNMFIFRHLHGLGFGAKDVEVKHCKQYAYEFCETLVMKLQVSKGTWAAKMMHIETFCVCGSAYGLYRYAPQTTTYCGRK